MASDDDEEEEGVEEGAPLTGLTEAETGRAALEAVQAAVRAALGGGGGGPAAVPVVALAGDAASAVVAAALAAACEDAPAAAAYMTMLADEDGVGETGDDPARERARYTADLLGLDLLEVSLAGCGAEDGPDCARPSALGAVAAAAAASAGRAPCLIFCGAASPAGVAAAVAAGALCPLAGLPRGVIASVARAAGVPDWAEDAEAEPEEGAGEPSATASAAAAAAARPGLTLVDARPRGAGGRVLAAAG